MLISLRTNLRISVTSAMVLTQSEDVLSTLLGANTDDRLQKEVLPAVLKNDVKFIQVLILKRDTVHYTICSKMLYRNLGKFRC